MNVRIIAATNQDLEDLVSKGSFRKDLYFRLNVFPIRVPPLRERSEDVPLLVSHFIQKNEQKVRKRFLRVSPQAMALLTTYSWPGNIRELENAIQRMMVVAKDETLELEDLPPQIRGMAGEPRDGAKDLKEMVRESGEIVERRVILDALAKAGGNVTHAARLLVISRATLQSKMKSFGLQASRSSKK